MSDYLTLGLLGHPLSHSLSPLLHAAALEYAGLKGQYLLFDVPPPEFDRGFDHMLQQGVNGFNVTIPHKETVFKRVHQLTLEALQAGAVNTIKVNTHGDLLGHNTDVLGFELALQECFSGNLKGKTALVIGAGGAARAAIVALNRLGIDTIKIRARDDLKVQSLITALQTSLIQDALNQYKNKAVSLMVDDERGYGEIAIVVNASPIGLLVDLCPEWLSTLVDNLSNQCFCFDMVYRKNMSIPIFSRLAQRRKLSTIDGLPMLIYQARFAFEYWTGIRVPYKCMRKSIGS